VTALVRNLNNKLR